MLTKPVKLACRQGQSETSCAFSVPASHNNLRLGLCTPASPSITLSPFLATFYDPGQDLTVCNGVEPVHNGIWLRCPSSSLVRCFGHFQPSTHLSRLTKLFPIALPSLSIADHGVYNVVLCLEPLTLRCSSACTSEATSWAPRRPLIGRKPRYSSRINPLIAQQLLLLHS